jgi:tRNA dimethylallyltransferase
MTAETHTLQAVVIAGPTASGKTSLGLDLAERLDTEIVSADSMQIYRGMEIGTAAPIADELARVRHNLVGIIEPNEHFSAGEFQKRSRAVVAQLNVRGRVAVVVGGSGLYLRALIDGLHEAPERDEELRKEYRSFANQHGVDALHTRLQEVDPGYAAQIGQHDLRRIVRALEMFELTGTTYTEHHRAHQAALDPLNALWIGIEWPREELYARIDARVDKMIAAGFEDEVRRLVSGGHAEHLLRIKTLGYREFLAYFRGDQTRDDAIEHMKRNTRRFAKRQLAWFRPDKRIHWLQAGSETTPASLLDRAMLLYESRL